MSAGDPRYVRRFLVEHVAPYWLLQLEIAACVLIQVVLEILDPLLLRALIDRALGDADLSLLTLLVALLAASLVFRVAFRVASTWLYSWGGLRILFDFRRRAFERVQTLSPYHLAGERRGDILARLTSDIDVLQRAAVHTVVNGAHDVLVIVGIAVVLVVLDAPLAGTLGLVYPPLVIGMVVLNRHLRRESTAARDAVGGLYDFLDERVGATRLVQEYRRERAQARRFVRVSRPWIRANLRLSIFSSFQVSLADVMAASAPIVVFLVGGRRVLDGTISLGTLVAFYTLAARLYRPFAGLVDINIDLQLARASLARVYPVIDREPAPRESKSAKSPAQVQGRVTFEHVDFSWGTESVLRSLTFTIEPSHRVAIVGPSGSGKSTLAALLARFLDPTRGRVSIDGVDLCQWRLPDLRRAVRVVPQEAQLFHDTLRENLLLAAPRATDDELIEALEAMELGPFLAGLPDGLDTQVGESGLRLSGGERQRVALARALLTDPQVLILDEATSALDPRTERMVLDRVKERMSGRTLVMIAHRLTSVSDADELLVICDGELVERGRHEPLLAAGGTYRELWDEQSA